MLLAPPRGQWSATDRVGLEDHDMRLKLIGERNARGSRLLVRSPLAARLWGGVHRRHRCYRSGGHRRGPPRHVRLAPRRPTQAPARLGQLTSPRKSASISHVSRGSLFCHCRAAVSVVALAALVDQARAETRAILSAGTPARAAAAAFGTERTARVSWDRARLPLSTGNGRWPERILRSLRCGAGIPGKRGLLRRGTAP